MPLLLLVSMEWSLTTTFAMPSKGWRILDSEIWATSLVGSQVRTIDVPIWSNMGVSRHNRNQLAMVREAQILINTFAMSIFSNVGQHSIFLHALEAATRAPRHPIYVVHVFGLKIRHTCGGVWECGVLSHIGKDGPCKCVYKDLGLSNHRQLVLVVMK